MEKFQFKSFLEIILPMSDEELRKFADAQARGVADSSRIEGLEVDQKKLGEEFYALYQKRRTEHAQV